MADQDFNIKVVTTADTTGIRQTEAELEKLKRQQATFAETARRQAAAAAAAARPTPAVSETLGVTGTAVGVGTIITLLTSAVTKWKAFNDEQDKWVDGMIKAQEKSRELGLAVADMLDAIKSAERIETEPLEQSFERLKYRVIELKTEMKLAFAAGQYEDVKKYAAQLGVVESQLNRVTSAIKNAAAAKKDFEISAFEAEAKEAEAKGDTAGAERARKTADALKRGIPLDELRPFEPAPVKAGIGESQELVDQIEKNKQAFVQAQIPKKWELDPTTGGMKEVTLSIKEQNIILKQILAQFQ